MEITKALIMSDKAFALKPCPFCDDNQDGFAGMIDGAFAKTSDGLFAVCCDNCGATGAIARTKAGAVKNWNHRPLEGCQPTATTPS